MTRVSYGPSVASPRWKSTTGVRDYASGELYAVEAASTYSASRPCDGEHGTQLEIEQANADAQALPLPLLSAQQLIAHTASQSNVKVLSCLLVWCRARPCTTDVTADRPRVRLVVLHSMMHEVLL